MALDDDQLRQQEEQVSKWIGDSHPTEKRTAALLYACCEIGIQRATALKTNLTALRVESPLLGPDQLQKIALEDLFYHTLAHHLACSGMPGYRETGYLHFEHKGRNQVKEFLRKLGCYPDGSLSSYRDLISRCGETGMVTARGLYMNLRALASGGQHTSLRGLEDMAHDSLFYHTAIGYRTSGKSSAHATFDMEIGNLVDLYLLVKENPLSEHQKI